MAVIQLAGIVSSVRGSISGNTYQRSAAGTIVRKKPLPVGRGTNAQLAQRYNVSVLNYLWNSLTDSQRQVWSSFAVFTNGVNRTNNQRTTGNNGKTQFFAVNSWLLQYGQTPVIVPTFGIPEYIVSPLLVNGNESDNLGKLTAPIDTTQHILVTQVSLPQSVSTVTANTGFRTLVYSQVDGDVQDWEAAYQAVYGIPLEIGKKYWVQYRLVNYITGSIAPIGKALVLYTTPSGDGIGSMIIGSTFIVA